LHNINLIEFYSQQEEIIMIKFTKIASVVLGAVVTMGAAGVANASAFLSIVGGATPLDQEVTGDAGGTTYSGGPGGAGIPSAAAGGWPNNGGGGYPPGFAQDPSFPPGGGAWGISGFHSSLLQLNGGPTNVIFQCMGSGDALLNNSFWVDPTGTGAGIYQKLFDKSITPCNVIRITPSCTDGLNQFTSYCRRLHSSILPMTGLPSITLESQWQS
jgi:hypothetical protein